MSMKTIHKKFRLAAAIGMGIGVPAASAYLLLGGEYLFYIPRWAAIVFYTGFAAGQKSYDLGLRPDIAAMAVGVLTVGLTYAIIAVLACLAWQIAKRKE